MSSLSLSLFIHRLAVIYWYDAVLEIAHIKRHRRSSHTALDEGRYKPQWINDIQDLHRAFGYM